MGSELSRPTPKSAAQLAKMRIAGRLAAAVLEMIDAHVRPGASTGALDRLCHEYIVGHGAVPAALGYRGFPRSICASVNQVVCHGIPSEHKRLRSGDILNLDVAVIKDGYHGDTSRMFMVGKVSPHARRLSRVAQECLYRAIAQVRAGVRLGDLGNLIQRYADANHYSVVREYCGHGIGENFHEAPHVLHYGRAGTGMAVEEGMTFTIEPMINLGGREVKLSRSDGWTVETADGRLSAQWEHTLAVTRDGCEVLTARRDEPFFQTA